MMSFVQPHFVIQLIYFLRRKNDRCAFVYLIFCLAFCLKHKASFFMHAISCKKVIQVLASAFTKQTDRVFIIFLTEVYLLSLCSYRNCTEWLSDYTLPLTFLLLRQYAMYLLMMNSVES